MFFHYDVKGEYSPTQTMKYIYVSSNEDKILEFKDTFPLSFDAVSLELPEIQDDPKNIARHKAKTAYEILAPRYDESIFVITDDVSLEISELKRLPGPYIKHFIANGFGLLKLMADAYGQSAKAVCTLGFAFKTRENFLIVNAVRGECSGRLVFDRINEATSNFGFDPIFLPDEEELTFGQMSFQEKNEISHRCNAVEKLCDYITYHDVEKEGNKLL